MSVSVKMSLSLSTASLVIVCFYDLTHGGEEGGEDEEHHQDAGVADTAHGPGPGDQRLSLNSFIRAITHPASV